MVNPIEAFAFLLLIAAAVVVAVLAVRHPLSFRIATRNVRRGRWRSILVVLGLLVGTAIISGSLTLNDTVSAVTVHYSYISWGHTDEGVYNSSVASGLGLFAPFPYSAYTELAQKASADPQIAGLTPEYVANASLFDRTDQVPETGAQLIGVNGNQSASLGSFTFDNGTSVAGPSPGEVLLDDQLAQNLGASVGDHLVLYGSTELPLTVEGVVKDDTRGGFLNMNSAFVTLAAAQTLWNASGTIDFIAVANTGSLTGAVAESNAVASFLNATLASFTPRYGLAAYPVLEEALNSAVSEGSSIATIFLVFGLFSILAGALLIVGIFVTLAEERKGEMGTLRAIGITRSGLVYTYLFEGVYYAAASALLGTLLGIAVGYVLIYFFVTIISASSPSVGAVFFASFTVTPQSLLIAYTAGFFLTLVTITAASLRVSRLNIVRAIRSIPEPAPTMRLYGTLALVGVAVAAVGALLFLPTRTGSSDVSLPILGLVLVILGGGLVATRFVPNRYAFSAAGALLVLWAGTSQVHTAVLGTQHTGTIAVLFVDGISMIVGGVLLFIFNSDLVVAGLTRLTGRSGPHVAVARVGFSYPKRRPTRSAVNFAIFAMVIFTIVIIACYGSAISTGLSNAVTAQSGGYTLFGVTQAPDRGLPGAIANNSTLAGEFSEAVPAVFGTAYVLLPGATSTYPENLIAPLPGGPANENFFDSNRYNFTQTLGGISTAQAWQEVETNGSVAVVDGNYAPGGINFGSGSHPTVALGAVVALYDPSTGRTLNITVIGYLSETLLNGFWVNAQAAATAGYTSVSGFLFTVAPGVSESTASQDLRRAFLPVGLQIFDFEQILASSTQTTVGFIGLLEVFVGLGLAVGIAGMGISAMRAVAERRTQIGMLRAAGFSERMVFASFLLEYSYITLFGIAVGTALAVWLYYNATLAQPGGQFGAFSLPGATILLITLVAYGLTMAAVVLPAWRAARLPPAEAVRYSE
jgi:putative ABC transport system permease protein